LFSQSISGRFRSPAIKMVAFLGINSSDFLKSWVLTTSPALWR